MAHEGMFGRFCAEASLTLSKLYDATTRHSVKTIAECFQEEFEILKDGEVWKANGVEDDGPRTRLWLERLYQDIYARYPAYQVVKWRINNIRMNPSERWATLRVHAVIQDLSTSMQFEEYAIYWFNLHMKKEIEDNYTASPEGLVKKTVSLLAQDTVPDAIMDLPDLLKAHDVLPYLNVMPLIRKIDYVKKDDGE